VKEGNMTEQEKRMGNAQKIMLRLSEAMKNVDV